MLANDDYFHRQLARGLMKESLIVRFLRNRGWAILPPYEKEVDDGKGPRLFLPFGLDDTELIAPDIQAFRDRQVRWFEVKDKSTGTYFRKNRRWQTGIDRRCYQDYVKVQKITKWPVWLLFLQGEATITNAPAGVKPCPTGLFGCPITQPYSDDGWYTRKGRRYDMVYWGIEDLRLLATLQEVLDGSASQAKQSIEDVEKAQSIERSLKYCQDHIEWHEGA